MEIKVCSKCKVEKGVCEFGKSNKTKSGLRSECKNCRKLYESENKEKISEYQKKYYNINREKKLTYQKKYYENNYDNILFYQKNYYNNNLEKKLNYSKEYRYNNIDKIKFYRKIYEKENRQNNFLFKLKQNVRHRVREFLKQKNIRKKSRTFELVGCTPEFLKKYLETKFTKGMAWDLMGVYIHIDHIIPLSSAKTEEELYKLCHYTNLQPLWLKDNLKKSNKMMYL